MAELNNHVHLLVVPYPAQGHLLPLLDFLHLLYTKFNLTITIATTPANLTLLSPLVSECPNIAPLVLPFPSYPALPCGCENVKDLPSFSQFPLLMHALSGLRDPLLNWARHNVFPPTAILSDIFCGWTYDLANELGIPRIVFVPTSALSVAVANALRHHRPQISNPDDPNDLVSIPVLPNSNAFRWFELWHLYGHHQQADTVSESIKVGFSNNTKSWGYVFDTCAELEGHYLNHLKEDLGHRRVWAVGPLARPRSRDRGGLSSVAVEEIASWLDKCEHGSVVYIAFGSQGEQTSKMAAVIAAALQKSYVRFVWAINDAKTLPEGFEEQASGKGIVIKGWAPQLEILKHQAVGAFLNHCGWNSVLEGFAAGVVLLVWPSGLDHYVHARLLVEEMGLAVRVCHGAPGLMPEIEELARILAEAVGKEGKTRRDKAAAMKEVAAATLKEGGSSYMDLQAFVEALRSQRATTTRS